MINIGDKVKVVRIDKDDNKQNIRIGTIGEAVDVYGNVVDVSFEPGVIVSSLEVNVNKNGSYQMWSNQLKVISE